MDDPGFIIEKGITVPLPHRSMWIILLDSLEINDSVKLSMKDRSNLSTSRRNLALNGKKFVTRRLVDDKDFFRIWRIS